MTATWVSYLAADAAALAGALAAVVTLLTGQRAQLRRRAAALEPHETGISELIDSGWEAWSD